mgnify:CR=1 FL=1
MASMQLEKSLRSINWKGIFKDGLSAFIHRNYYENKGQKISIAM